jgi:hypothetical protein
MCKAKVDQCEEGEMTIRAFLQYGGDGHSKEDAQEDLDEYRMLAFLDSVLFPSVGLG